MHSNKKWIFIITLGVAILSMALFFVALVNGWFGIARWGSGAGEFCERFRPGLIKQPANTWSNLGFITAGLLMAGQLSRGMFKANNNSFTAGIFYATFFSCLAVLLGPGSMAMHASGGDLGGFFDMLSMYLVASFTLSYAMERFFSWKPWHFLISFTIILTFCIWADKQPYHIIFGFFGDTVFFIFISATIIFEGLNTYVRKLTHHIKWGFASLGAILAAFGVWGLSTTDGPWCNPDSLIQGHAIWHLLDAVSVYCLFRFYVSEHKGDVK
jgi:Ceramidase